MHATLVLACVLAGAPSYVKTLLAIGCIAFVWRLRPRRAGRCALHAEGWRVAGRDDVWEDCVLAAATYTRLWAELVFSGNPGSPRRVLIWRDAVPRAAWRALVVHLREGQRCDARHVAAPAQGSELDCRRHDE
jgi:hypothetical protein